MEADRISLTLFEAAMALGSGRKSSARGAIFDAARYLYPDFDVGRPTAIQAHTLLRELLGDVDSYVQYRYAGTGGTYPDPRAKDWLIMCVLMVYEYVVCEMRGQRSEHEAECLEYAAIVNEAKDALWTPT